MADGEGKGETPGDDDDTARSRAGRTPDAVMMDKVGNGLATAASRIYAVMMDNGLATAASKKICEGGRGTPDAGLAMRKMSKNFPRDFRDVGTKNQPTIL